MRKNSEDTEKSIHYHEGLVKYILKRSSQILRNREVMNKKIHSRLLKKLTLKNQMKDFERDIKDNADLLVDSEEERKGKEAF